MKMGKKDPRCSMSKSTKGKSPINKGGRNPLKLASPYEVPGVGECNPPKGPSLKEAPRLIRWRTTATAMSPRTEA